MKQFYILSLLLTFNFTFSQVYFEDDFNGSGPGLLGWTLVDNDGNTPNTSVVSVTDAWVERVSFVDGTDMVAFSTSWYNPAGTSDDWMITPAINLTTDATLTWDVRSPDSGFLDGYEVRLSTQTTNLTDFTTILYSTTAASTDWTNLSIDLNPYTGKTVYIAWRNNTTDKFGLCINNVKVQDILTLSIQQNTVSDNLFTISPNPSSNFIKIKGLTTIENYEIYNTIGQRIKRGVVVENEKIDIQNLTNGLYSLKFKNGNTIKFIKK